ncbi:phage tail tape measure protein [Methylocystis sp. IM3]|uniref:phage tail tape measure protein n=1 Tax=unclassified Methylocystis TaxID=2625913 RepID=UPI0030FB3ADA
MNNSANLPDLGQSSLAFATQDLTSAKNLLDQIGASGEKASKILANGFGAAAASGKGLNETLLTIGQSLAKLALQEGAKSLSSGLANSLKGLFGNAFSGSPQITPFAEGGVVASPAYFANGGSTGLMGERGAEAIMPLARGPDGRLGVVSQGGQGRPVSVTVNIAAQDVDSFHRSEAQITGALARAVARGQRQL